jgi:anti-repressor protein
MPEKELILVKKIDGQPLASSRTIAHVFNKDHADVLKKIRNMKMSNDFRIGNFTEGTYKDGNGDTQPRFLMTRDGCSMVIMSFTGEKATLWKEKFIAAFNAMEKELLKSKQLPDFTNPAEAAEAWAKEYREKEKAQLALEEAKPKIEFAEQIQESNDAISVREFAKVLTKNGYKTGQNKLFKELRDLNLIFLNNQNKNEPYQTAMESGWLKYDEFTKKVKLKDSNEVVNKICHKIKITGKGQVYITRKLIPK